MKTIKNKIECYNKKALLINAAGLITVILSTLEIDPLTYTNGLMSFVEIARDILGSINVANTFALTLIVWGFFTTLKKEK